MKHLLIVLVISLITITLLTCSSDKKEAEETQKSETTTVEVDTVKVTCPGCGMVHTKAEMTAYDIDGKTMHFCSDMCKDNYIAQKDKENE